MATIVDIAKAAGVSSMTVSRVLNGQAEYRRPTYAKRAAKIRDLAIQMGYKPNTSAMAVRSGRFDCVALLLSADRTWSILPDTLLAGIQRGLADKALHLTIASFPDEKLTNDRDVPRLLRHLSSNGLLINYNAMIPPRMIDLIKSYCLPSVWINSKHPVDAIHPDDLGAAAQATRELVQRGHRRIAFLNYNNRVDSVNEHYSFTDRFAGYAEVMKEAGLPFYRFGDSDWRDEGRIISSMVEFLRQPDRPTAIVAYGAIEARAALAASNVAGLRVPQDLSIITFAERALDDMGPMLATCLIPEAEIGMESVNMLLEKIAAPEESLATKVIPFGFEPGHTIAAVPGV